MPKDFYLHTELRTAIIFSLLPEYSVVHNNNNLEITYVFVTDVHTGGSMTFKTGRLSITARTEIAGSRAAYPGQGRASRCRSGRWPSSRCSSGRCSWVLGCCSGGRQTVLRPHMSGNTGPRTPRTPSCRGLMSEIEHGRHYNSEGRKAFKICTWKSLAYMTMETSSQSEFRFQ